MKLRIQDEGSVVILHPLDAATEDWLTEHLPDDAPAWGLKGFAVERNYLAPILNGFGAAGGEIPGMVYTGDLEETAPEIMELANDRPDPRTVIDYGGHQE